MPTTIWDRGMMPGAEYEPPDRPFPEELKGWFGKSHVVDEKGAPLLVYRGEHGRARPGIRFHTRTPRSISFGSPSAAETYATNPNNMERDKQAIAPRVTPAYLKIEKPFVNTPDDPFLDMSDVEKALGREQALHYAKKHADRLENTNQWQERLNPHGEFMGVEDFLKKHPERLGELHGDIFPFLDDPTFVKKLQKAGYDGAIHGGMGDNALEPEYRIFHPDQAKFALSPHLAEGGQVNEPERDLSPIGLYSHAAEVADRLPQMVGTPQQFGAMLQKQGVKPDELKHSGFDQAFKDQKKITKQQLAQHFKSKLPKVQETVLSKPETVSRYPEPPSDEPGTKYHQYTLPGGKNYREVLLHLNPYPPVKPLAREMGLGDWDTLTDAQRDDVLEEHDRRYPPQDEYNSSHWDTPNVLAHLRLSDRPYSLAKGERDWSGTRRTNLKALHLEELQSDWAQEGRKKGFKTGAASKAYQEYADQLAPRIRQAIIADRGNMGPEGAARVADNLMRRMEPHNMATYFGEERKLKQLWDAKVAEEQGVPTAPYVDSTQKWLDLGLKRVLHEAAKGGYDKVVVTPGQEQADRYDLGKHVKEVRYQPHTGALDAYDHGGAHVMSETNLKPEKLESYIGKEAAKKLLETKPFFGAAGTPHAVHVLKGDDLHVGGEGMKAFYDKLLPAALEKLAKKHDPQAKVQLHGHKYEQKSYAPKAGYSDTSKHLHSLDITPEMRKSILRGQPAFKEGGKVEKQLEMFRQPKKHVELPPFRGRLQFVPHLDQLFGHSSAEAGQKVRAHTRATGMEGATYGNLKAGPADLIGGTEKNISESALQPLVDFAEKKRSPFYSVHTHPSGNLLPSNEDLVTRAMVNARRHHMMIEAMNAPHNRTVVAPARGLVPAGPFNANSATHMSKMPSSIGFRDNSGLARFKDLNRAMRMPQNDAAQMIAAERMARLGLPIYMDNRTGTPGAQGTLEEMLPEYLNHLKGDLSFAKGGEVEGHPARIPTRLVTSKKFPSEPHHAVDMESFRADPKLFAKNMELVRAYPNMRETVARKADHDQLAAEFVRHAKENLLALHDAVPEGVRARSKLWYRGARNIIDKWSKDYNLPDHSIAGTIAALSPQKDWYQNVSLARRILDVMRGSGGNYYHGFAMSPEMEAKFKATSSLRGYRKNFEQLRGKTLADIDRMEDVSPEKKLAMKALWVRLHDEAHNERAHQLVSPEGEFGENVKTKGGADAGTGWGSLPEIMKAIASIEASNDPARLSGLMGQRHKVRNFYNNMLDPDAPHGDVTIDTHAVAAALYRALSGNSKEVSHNFANYAGKGIPSAGSSAITGIGGLYPAYAEAYRQAAKERGILPREMQSITWEAIRGLFPDTFKTEANNGKIDNIWLQYRQGKISQKRAREKINAIANVRGIGNPSWLAGDDEGGGHPAYTGELPRVGLRGSPPEGVVPRGRGRAARDVPEGAPRPAGLSPGSQIGLISPEGVFARGGMIDRALRVVRRKP